MADKKDYEVGYRKPPKETRFKTGRSGNPRGRPRKPKETFTSLLEEEGQVRIPIVINGKRTFVSKKKALSKKLWSDALSGNPRAQAMLEKRLTQEAEKRAVDQTEAADARKSLREKLLGLAEMNKRSATENGASPEEIANLEEIKQRFMPRPDGETS